METVAKGIYVSKEDEKFIVFVFDETPDRQVLYTEAIHPVINHSVKTGDFLEKFKKVHKVSFVESE